MGSSKGGIGENREERPRKAREKRNLEDTGEGY